MHLRRGDLDALDSFHPGQPLTGPQRGPVGLQQIESLGVRGARAKKQVLLRSESPEEGRRFVQTSHRAGLWAQARFKVTPQAYCPRAAFPRWVPYQEAESLTQASPHLHPHRKRGTLSTPQPSATHGDLRTSAGLPAQGPGRHGGPQGTGDEQHCWAASTQAWRERENASASFPSALKGSNRES